VLSLESISAGAQPFFAALLAHMFPERPIVAVTEGLRTQEVFHQDVETWVDGTAAKPLFYPAWEILPHEARLPHADVISERLATLIALGQSPGKIVVASVVSLLQKTLPPDALKRRIRELRRGETLDPLDLVEWLEEQSYDAEVQVTEKGHVSMRGGIVDFWPSTSPWPVRLEFFGSELESLRYFDPVTQISRDEIPGVTVPPGGELGLMKKEKSPSTASLLEYLPSDTIFLLCEP
jgi:transcription-repair coupling factor (superfamily II helicase)